MYITGSWENIRDHTHQGAGQEPCEVCPCCSCRRAESQQRTCYCYSRRQGPWLPLLLALFLISPSLATCERDPLQLLKFCPLPHRLRFARVRGPENLGSACACPRWMFRLIFSVSANNINWVLQIYLLVITSATSFRNSLSLVLFDHESSPVSF